MAKVSDRVAARIQLVVSSSPGVQPASSTVPEASTAPGPWPGLYLGIGPAGPVCAGPEQAVLVLGPPRAGKTSAIVAPDVPGAPGAVVSTSTKADVLGVTAHARARRGRIWVFDPSATTPTPPGADTLAWSPVPGCRDWDTAVATAHALVRAARPGADGEHAAHWTERAQALLAPLLHAADLVGTDISWVLRWTQRHELIEPLGILARHADELAADTLVSIANSDERERSAVFSTTAGILAAYRSVAALGHARHPTFDPERFVASADTVYICAPAATQDRAAPIVVALLERIRTATYRRPPGSPSVVWALDEAATIAPLPTLPAIVAEGGGQGLVTLCCLQDLSQARGRWGAAAEGFPSLFATQGDPARHRRPRHPRARQRPRRRARHSPHLHQPPHRALDVVAPGLPGHTHRHHRAAPGPTRRRCQPWPSGHGHRHPGPPPPGLGPSHPLVDTTVGGDRPGRRTN